MWPPTFNFWGVSTHTHMIRYACIFLQPHTNPNPTKQQRQWFTSIPGSTHIFDMFICALCCWRFVSARSRTNPRTFVIKPKCACANVHCVYMGFVSLELIYTDKSTQHIYIYIAICLTHSKSLVEQTTRKPSLLCLVSFHCVFIQMEHRTRIQCPPSWRLNISIDCKRWPLKCSLHVPAASAPQCSTCALLRFL